MKKLPQLDEYSERYNKGFWNKNTNKIIAKNTNTQIVKNIIKDVKSSIEYFKWCKKFNRKTYAEDIETAVYSHIENAIITAFYFEPHELINTINRSIRYEDKWCKYREKMGKTKLDGRTREGKFYNYKYVQYRMFILYNLKIPKWVKDME